MPSWSLRALTGLLVLLVVATGLAASYVRNGPERLEAAATPWRGGNELTVRHREVATAAEELTLAFLSVDHRDMDELVDRVLARSTGDFAEDYAAERDRLVEEAERAEAISAAEVVAVGVADLETDSATVLVAADTVVRNASTGEGAEARYYRLRIEMVRHAGRWLASDVEFVR